MQQFFCSPFTIPIVAIAGTFLWLTISALAKAVHDIVRHRNEIELKQVLVERGLGAEEIERILLVTTSYDEKLA
jgi:CRISPR/Cas system CMR subunit Cmr4 (Cas7 group RAMP superfamily)